MVQWNVVSLSPFGAIPEGNLPNSLKYLKSSQKVYYISSNPQGTWVSSSEIFSTHLPLSHIILFRICLNAYFWLGALLGVFYAAKKH